MIKRVLIANRGEIAIRIMHTLRAMNIQSISVFTETDRDAFHPQFSDEAYFISNYLDKENIIALAKKIKADAIHPGYGFLSENPDFSDLCRKNKIIFIGPTADAMRAMGNKISAKILAKKSGVPTVPSFNEGDKIVYPVLIKAAAGGGGRGMRIVKSQSELKPFLEMARREALAYFGDETVYLEKYIERPHHIEVQLIGDQHRNIVHLFERECSIQRRHQKIIEESPSPFISDKTRKKLCDAAVTLAKKINYTNAGTMEFIVDEKENFYFLEMNTRLQVEHPVTEMITGIDLVKTQILVANGEKLPFKQKDIVRRGHAMECRINAEDPKTYLPSSGKISALQNPIGPFIRNDSCLYENFTVPMHYDSLLSKLIAWGNTREEAVSRLKQALHQYVILGIKTNIPLHQQILSHKKFISGDYTTKFLETDFQYRDPVFSKTELEWIKNACSTLKEPVPETESLWKKTARMESLRHEN